MQMMNGAGIYRISVRRHGDQVMYYIGQASNFRIRKASHLSKLRSGAHKNEHLQRAFDKHGEAAFEFCVLLVCDKNKDLLTEHEQRTLDAQIAETGAESVYNMQRECVTSLLGVKFSDAHRLKISSALTGIKRSDETRKKISEAKKGWKPSADHIKHLSTVNRGRKKCPEAVAKLAALHRGTKKPPEEIARRQATRAANKAARPGG